MWADAFPALLALANGVPPFAGLVLVLPVAALEVALVVAPVAALGVEVARALRSRAR